MSDAPQVPELIAEISAIKEMVSAYMTRMDAAIGEVKKYGEELAFKLLSEVRQEVQDNDQGGIIQDDADSAFSIRYRNDTWRAAQDSALPVSDPPIHRLEWIAQASPYDPSTITTENPTGNEWANELWQPVLHGEYVIYPGDSP